jgi:transposase
MNIHDFERIVKTEKSAMRYIKHLCKKSGKLRCPACITYKLYKIENGKRLRCARCGYTFHLLTGRWLNRVKINIRDWLWIIKLFELEASAAVIAEESGVSYPTVLKAVDTIRMSIALSNGDMPDETGNTGAFYDLGPVFGIFSDSDGITRIAPLSADVVLYATRIERGYLILTERSVTHSSVLVRDRKIKITDYGKNFPNCRVYCDCEGFWPYAKERLAKHHGVSSGKLPLYLKESEFRWNNKNSTIFEALIQKLCCFMPDQHGHDGKTLMAV